MKTRSTKPLNTHTMVEYQGSYIAFIMLAVAYMSTGLMLLVSHFPPENAQVVFLMTVESLLSVTLCTMFVPMVEMLVRAYMSMKVYKIDKRGDLIEALLVTLKTTTTTSSEEEEMTPGKAHMEVCSMMKTMLSLEIERLEATKKLRESIPPSSSLCASATPSVTNDEMMTKNHDEGASARSAAQTVV